MESLLDLGMSLPSTMGHNGHEMPQNMVKYDCELALLTGSWPFQLPLQRLKHDHYKMLTFNTSLKGVQGGDKNKAL